MFLPLSVYAAQAKNSAEFFGFHIPYKSAKWQETSSRINLRDGITQVFEKTFWYKNRKLKIMSKKVGPLPVKKVYSVHILDDHTSIGYHIPSNRGIITPSDSPINPYSPSNIVNGPSRYNLRVGLKKTGETELINGVLCDVYYWPSDNVSVKEVKEWRKPDGFVMKSDVIYESKIEVKDEVRNLETNIEIPSYTFEIPTNVKIEDFDQLKKEVLSGKKPLPD